MPNPCLSIAEPPRRLLELVTAEKEKKPTNATRKQSKSFADKDSQSSSEISPYIRRALEDETLDVANAADGTRNNRLNIAAVKLGHYVGGGEIMRSDVEKALLRAATISGLSEGESLKTIASGLATGIREPKTAPPPKKANLASGRDHKKDAVSNKNITPEDIIQAAGEQEQGAANLFKVLFKEKFAYDHGERQWYEFVGHSWERDKVAQAHALVDEVQALFRQEYMRVSIERRALASQLAQAELDAANDPENNGGNDELKAQNKALAAREKLLLKAIRMLQTSYHREQVVKLAAQGENSLGISGDEWDQVKRVLPCQNGVVDLQTGELRAGKPFDYLRNAVPFDYDPTGRCSGFLKFLLTVMDDDAEMVAFLKRVFGHSIGGMPIEHVLAVFVGAGANGKSVLAKLIAYVLGELAWSVRAEFFLDSGRFGSADTPSASLLSVRGRRLVFGSEPADDRAFDLSKIKLFTGGDRLTCRAPYAKHEISFEPTHVPILLANNKPAACAADDAFWRRVLIVNFPISFVDDPQKPYERLRDRDIFDKLKSEAQGILNWLIEGYQEWHRDGLQVPAKVRAATMEYRSETDTVLQFVDDRCNRVENAEEPFYVLYEAFKRWSQEMRLPKMWSQKKFSQRLARHFKKNRDIGNGVVFIGLAVVSDRNDERVSQAQNKHRAAMNMLEDAENAEYEARKALAKTKKLKAENEKIRHAMGLGDERIQNRRRLA